MNGSSVIITFRIDVFVARRIGKISSFVVQGVIQLTRADGDFGSEVFQVSIVHEPFVANGRRPFRTVFTFPLGTEIPTQRNRSAPENGADERSGIRLRIGQVDVNETVLEFQKFGFVFPESVSRRCYRVFSVIGNARLRTKSNAISDFF